MLMTSRLDYKTKLSLFARECQTRILLLSSSSALCAAGAFAMDISLLLICGMLITRSLGPNAIPLTTVQDKVMKSTPTANRSLILTLNETDVSPRRNRSRAAQEPHLDTSVKNTKLRQSSEQSRPRKKHPSNKSERRKICFGFKMDRISDLSGMGCKSD